MTNKGSENLTQDEIVESVVDVLESEGKMGVTELTYSIFEDPSWSDREKVQSALTELVSDRRSVAWLPDYTYQYL